VVLCTRALLDPDPARYPVKLVDLGRIWIRPDVHNYDIKHDSIFSLLEMTHENTELYTRTH